MREGVDGSAGVGVLMAAGRVGRNELFAIVLNARHKEKHFDGVQIFDRYFAACRESIAGFVFQ
jgi:hypothetical protein